MKIEFEVSALIPAKPERVFEAWLDSGKHSAMTGGKALVSATEGEKFEAWDQYISGQNLEVEAPRRILQKWRTTEFEEKDEYSLLEILFLPDDEGTLITIHHSNLPEHGMQYKQGWVDAYFEPMKAYFSSSKSGTATS